MTINENITSFFKKINTLCEMTVKNDPHCQNCFFRHQEDCFDNFPTCYCFFAFECLTNHYNSYKPLFSEINGSIDHVYYDNHKKEE